MSIRSRTTSCLLALLVGVVATPPAVAGATATPGGTAAPAHPASSSNRKPHRTAIATWFGPGFYGQLTACGQTLTPAVIGVAHRTLPCGTLVKIRYKAHSVIVPVLDRGPYSNGADWDLTAGAAQALGVTETVRIAARIVGSAPNSPTLGLPAPTPTASVAGGAVAG